MGGHQEWSSFETVSFVSVQVLSAGADGLVKLWDARTSECVNTFDEHEDRIWAMAAAGSEDQHMASASADGKLVVWQDCTQAELDTAADQLQQTAAQQQLLSNAIKVGCSLLTTALLLCASMDSTSSGLSKSTHTGSLGASFGQLCTGCLLPSVLLARASLP